MKRRNQDFLLGLVVLLFAALLVSTILFLYPLLRGSGKMIVIHFNHETGLAPLKPGSQVILGGSQQVGQVRDVRLKVVDAPPGGPAKTETVFVVTCEVDPNLVLYNDSRITTDQPAVGGGGSVVIQSVGSPGHPLQLPLRGQPPISLSAAISQLSQRLLADGGMIDRLDDMLNPEVEGSIVAKIVRSLDDFNAMTGELRVQLSPREQATLLFKVHQTLDDINGATRALRDQTAREDAASVISKVHVALDRIQEGLAQATELLRENRPAIRTITSGVEEAVTTINAEMIARLRGEFDRGNPAALFGKVHAAMDRVNAGLADMQDAAGEGKRLLVTNRPAIDRTLQNVREMSEQLRLASQEIRLAPWRLLFPPDTQEREKIGIFETARMFAEAATYLDDAAARLQAVLESRKNDSSPAAAAEVQAVEAALKEAFERFKRAEGYLWERLK